MASFVRSKLVIEKLNSTKSQTNNHIIDITTILQQGHWRMNEKILSRSIFLMRASVNVSGLDKNTSTSSADYFMTPLQPVNHIEELLDDLSQAAAR